MRVWLGVSSAFDKTIIKYAICQIINFPRLRLGNITSLGKLIWIFDIALFIHMMRDTIEIAQTGVVYYFHWTTTTTGLDHWITGLDVTVSKKPTIFAILFIFSHLNFFY